MPLGEKYKIVVRFLHDFLTLRLSILLVLPIFIAHAFACASLGAAWL